MSFTFVSNGGVKLAKYLITDRIALTRLVKNTLPVAIGISVLLLLS